MTRPTWDFYFMRLAHEAATMGTCSRRQVGAIAVRDKRVLATGFNGAPAGTHHCEHEKYLVGDRCSHCGAFSGYQLHNRPFGAVFTEGLSHAFTPETHEARDPDLVHIVNRYSCSNAVHAEANVLAYAAADGVALRGATIYTNTYPCHGCAKQMVSCGIIEVVYDADYCNDPLVARLCEEAKMVLRRYESSVLTIDSNPMRVPTIDSSNPMCVCTHREGNHHPLDRSGQCSFCRCLKFEAM
jgi:dCMP deaminase